MLFEPLHGIGIEDFGPNIGIISRIVAIGKDVIEVRRAIARRRRGDIEFDASQELVFERFEAVARNHGQMFQIELIPSLIEHRGPQILDRRIALIEFLGIFELLDELGGDLLARFVVNGIIVEHFGPKCPDFVKLRREFDEIARHVLNSGYVTFDKRPWSA